jgi:predicted nucleic acid-binding protein
MLFVYHFERNRKYGRRAAALFDAAEHGRVRLITSVLSLMEVLVVPRRSGDERLCAQYRDIFRLFPNLTVQAVDEEIADVAATLRATTAIRPPDAIHLATAIVSGADAFISQDRRLARVADIPVLPLGRIDL